MLKASSTNLFSKTNSLGFPIRFLTNLSSKTNSVGISNKMCNLSDFINNALQRFLKTSRFDLGLMD